MIFWFDDFIRLGFSGIVVACYNHLIPVGLKFYVFLLSRKSKLKVMTTFSFEVEQAEVSKLKAVLKALGVKKMKIKEDETKLSKEEFYAKIDKSIKQAADGKVHKLTPELKKELFKTVL